MVPAPIHHRQGHRTNHQYDYAQPLTPHPTYPAHRQSASTHQHRVPSLLSVLRSLSSSSLNKPTLQKERHRYHRQRAPSLLTPSPSARSRIQSRPIQCPRAPQGLAPSSIEVHCTRSSGIKGVGHSFPIMTAHPVSRKLRDPQNSITSPWTRSSGSYSRSLFAIWIYIAVLLLAPLALLSGTESIPLQSDDLRLNMLDISKTVAMNLSTIDQCDPTTMTGFSDRQSYVPSDGPIRLVAINHGMI